MEELELIDFSKIKVIKDLAYDLKDIDEPRLVSGVVVLHMDELLEVFDPTNILEVSSSSLEEELPIISDLAELKALINDVIIRFDTNPCNYTKEDFRLLLHLISGSLLYLYTSYINRELVDWNLEDSTKPDYIKNKPEYITLEEIEDEFTYSAPLWVANLIGSGHGDDAIDNGKNIYTEENAQSVPLEKIRELFNV